MIIKDDNQIIDDKYVNLQKRDDSWHKENGAENVTSGRIVFPVNDDLEEMRRLDKKEEKVEVKKVMVEEEKDDDVFPDAESWAEQEGNGESSTYVKAINGASVDCGEYGNGRRNQTSQKKWLWCNRCIDNGFGARYDVKVMAVAQTMSDGGNGVNLVKDGTTIAEWWKENQWYIWNILTWF